MTSTLKKPILLFIAVSLTALLGIEYLRLLRPAQAREIAAACRGLRPSVQNKQLGMLPTKAPNFTMQDHTGKSVSLEQFRGQVVVLRFWASWCETCKAEQPSLEELAAEAGGDYVVLAPASDPNWDLVRKKLPNGSAATVLLDPPEGDSSIGKVASAYGVEKVPETFIIDRDGIIRYYLVNKRDWRSGVAKTCIESL